MSMPFYASAEQIMRDRSEYARKGIARGRSVVVLTYADGVLFVAENASSALHKVSEIYDRIAFAAVGKYNEFENLRVAGIRLADLRGYSYDRREGDPVVDLADLVQRAGGVLCDEDDAVGVLQHDDAAATRDALAGVFGAVRHGLLG